ncbi:hypothetical protein OH76DRAFT_122596 [Lentinus brumalis]|uniref:Uncharacterized protein n=1 Tax=Lentinus brumalis TaxID=2498619 RepID=A0A371DJM5_9APHY|nr:hypothetical protein OH76DRAFT_122596 [Polyporus brumalis]
MMEQSTVGEHSHSPSATDGLPTTSILLAAGGVLSEKERSQYLDGYVAVALRNTTACAKTCNDLHSWADGMNRTTARTLLGAFYGAISSAPLYPLRPLVCTIPACVPAALGTPERADHAADNHPTQPEPVRKNATVASTWRDGSSMFRPSVQSPCRWSKLGDHSRAQVSAAKFWPNSGTRGRPLLHCRSQPRVGNVVKYRRGRLPSSVARSDLCTLVSSSGSYSGALSEGGRTLSTYPPGSVAGQLGSVVQGPGMGAQPPRAL